MNKLRPFFNNIINQVIYSEILTQFKQSHSVTTKYDHIFLLWHISIEIKNLGINKAC